MTSAGQLAPWIAAALAALALAAVYARDRLQTRDPLRRNFPVVAWLYRGWERLARETRGDIGRRGRPIPERVAEVVRARADGIEPAVSFGDRLDRPGWLAHSLMPVPPSEVVDRVAIGGPGCARPYSASLLNVSALSFGALSNAALLALSAGAAKGGFACNTGEAGLAPSFLEGGGNLVWQIGTGYFGCRTRDGRFDPVRFAEQAGHARVRMIELKLSQGAKPAAGAFLPGAKVTAEVARISGVPAGMDSYAPARHPAFDTPVGLLAFVQQLRELSGGKPVGIKLCIGRAGDFLAICKAMLETGIAPDYVCVDDAAGGSGAAPVEFATHVGAPLGAGLPFVHGVLRGIDLRGNVRIVASGGVATGFDLVSRLAAGADCCAAARSFMLALGCIQALACATNACPTGIATQRARLARGIVPATKADQVACYQALTVESARALIGALGLRDPAAVAGSDIGGCEPAPARGPLAGFAGLERGALLEGRCSEAVRAAWADASANAFRFAARR